MAAAPRAVAPPHRPYLTAAAPAGAADAAAGRGRPRGRAIAGRASGRAAARHRSSRQPSAAAADCVAAAGPAPAGRAGPPAAAAAGGPARPAGAGPAAATRSGAPPRADEMNDGGPPPDQRLDQQWLDRAVGRDRPRRPPRQRPPSHRRAMRWSDGPCGAAAMSTAGFGSAGSRHWTSVWKSGPWFMWTRCATSWATGGAAGRVGREDQPPAVADRPRQ